MEDFNSSDVVAFVGVSFSNHVIYNIVENDGEFDYTGLSIINFLNNDKNKFVSGILLSQSYNGIDLLLDDRMDYGKYRDSQNTNISAFSDVYSFMCTNNSIDYFYIYDIIEDIFFVKTPEINDPIGIDYKNNEDVRAFRNLIRD